MNKYRNKATPKRKFIPKLFRRRNQPSVSDLLSAATYRRKNKELLRNNKDLANALQEAQCVISSNTTILRNLTKDGNQVLLAKVKIKNMAKTIQKLVVDLNDVLECLDVSYMNIPRPNVNENVKMRIPEPDLEKIDESVVSSESEKENEDQEMESPIHYESPPDTNLFGNTSVTEVYNVQQYFANTQEKVKDVQAEIVTVDTIETQNATPQLNLTHSSRVFESEQLQKSPEDVDKLINSVCSPVKFPKTAATSKIPIRKNLFQEPDDIEPPLVLGCENRRETFVVPKYPEVDQFNQVSTTAKRGTFTIAEICREVQVQSERRGTFVIPPLPTFNFSKPNAKMPPPQADFGVDDKTVHLGDDMDLTEIIPTATLAAVSSTLLNKNVQPQQINSFHPFQSKDKEGGAPEISPSVIKMKNISPIAKLNTKSDSNKGTPNLETGAKLMDPKLPETVMSSKSKIDFELTPDGSEDVFSCEPIVTVASRISRKSVLPSFVSLSASEKLSKQKRSHIEEEMSRNIGFSERLSSIFSKKPSIRKSNQTVSSSSNISSKEKKEISTLLLKINSPGENTGNTLDKSPKKSYTESDCFSSEQNSDCDPDFVADAPAISEAKRIPGRRSIKPNRRKPFIFKSLKNRKSVGKIKENIDALLEIKEKYDFSSSDSEDENSKNTKVVKCKNPKKSSCKPRKSKGKSTVAILERDINLKFQDQSRKKRSLKRRVSFVDPDASPSTKDEEESTEQSTEIKQKEICAPRKSILKSRTSVVPTEKQDSPSIECHKLLPNITEATKSSEKKSTAVIDSNNEKVSNKESKVQAEEINARPKYTSDTTKQKKSSLKPKDRKTIQADSDVNTLNIEKTDRPIGENVTLSSSKDSLIIGSFNETKESSSVELGNKVASETETSKLKTSKKSSNYSDFRLSSETSARSRSRSKRTFSGVSERSSKKRFTANDDILEDVVSNFEEVRPEMQQENNNKDGLNGKISILNSENINISDSSNKKDSPNLKEDSELKINKLEKLNKNIRNTKSSNLLNKDENEKTEVNSDPTLNPKQKTKVDFQSESSDKASASSEPIPNAQLNEGKKSEDKIKPQSSKTKTITFELADKTSSSSKVKSNQQTDKENLPSVKNSKSVKTDDQLDHAVKSNEPKIDTEVITEKVPDTKKKRKAANKPKKNSEACVLSELTSNKLSEEVKSPKKSIKGTSPPSSKIRKTVSSGGIDLKENLAIPDLESGGRSRRNRPRINFKEPSSRQKMRRE